MNFKNYTPEQLKEIQIEVARISGKLIVAISDGWVHQDQEEKVWWKYEDGPELVEVSWHWVNILQFPHIYSYAKPTFKLVYD
jgi:hypothetical protein